MADDGTGQQEGRTWERRRQRWRSGGGSGAVIQLRELKSAMPAGCYPFGLPQTGAQPLLIVPAKPPAHKYCSAHQGVDLAPAAHLAGAGHLSAEVCSRVACQGWRACLKQEIPGQGSLHPEAPAGCGRGRGGRAGNAGAGRASCCRHCWYKMQSLLPLPPADPAALTLVQGAGQDCLAIHADGDIDCIRIIAGGAPARAALAVAVPAAVAAAPDPAPAAGARDGAAHQGGA